MAQLSSPLNRVFNRLEHGPLGVSAQVPPQSEQAQLPLIARLDGPALVHPDLIGKARTYREACRLGFELRRVRGMTRAVLAAEADLYPAHVSDYLHPDDKPSRRSLPAEAVARFESVVGNTFVSQWLARQASLTVLEEVQALTLQRRAA